MSVKAGQIVFDANGFLVDRIQTGGVTNLNIPADHVEEVGNFQTVGIVYDIPDLSFDVQSLDVTTDFEAVSVGVVPTAVTNGPGGMPLDFQNATPLDVVSDFRSGNNLFNIVRGVVIPYLTLETVAYKYGVKANAEQTFTYRGDAIYYVPGVPYRESFTGGATSYNFANPAIVYHEAGTAIYALGVCWTDHTTGLYKRLIHTQDFTDTATGITLNAGVTIPATASVSICYGSLTPKTVTQAQSSAALTIKPAAIRSKNIDIYLSNNAATPTFSRLTGVQTFDVTRKVTLVNDEEFGNAHYVSTDWDVPSVDGTLGLKNVDPADVIAKIQQLAGVPLGEVSGPLTTPPIALEARIFSPVDGHIIKTLYIPDATFTAPPIQGRVKQRLETSFKFASNSGILQVFKGAR